MTALLEDRAAPVVLVMPRPLPSLRTRSRPARRPRKAVCKLCKGAFQPDEGAFFVNGQTGRRTDFQCRICTAWENAPTRTPGNIRTDVTHNA